MARARHAPELAALGSALGEWPDGGAVLLEAAAVTRGLLLCRQPLCSAALLLASTWAYSGVSIPAVAVPPLLLCAGLVACRALHTTWRDKGPPPSSRMDVLAARAEEWADVLGDLCAVLGCGPEGSAAATAASAGLALWAVLELAGLRLSLGAVALASLWGVVLLGLLTGRAPARSRPVRERPRPAARRGVAPDAAGGGAAAAAAPPPRGRGEVQRVEHKLRAASLPAHPEAAAAGEDDGSLPTTPEHAARPALDISASQRGAPGGARCRFTAVRVPRCLTEDGVTYFVIEVTAAPPYPPGGWTVQRRYNRFHDAFRSLAATFKEKKSAVPHFPGKTMRKCSGKDLDRRREQIEAFLSEMVRRAPKNPAVHRALTRFLEPPRPPPADAASAQPTATPRPLPPATPRPGAPKEKAD